MRPSTVRTQHGGELLVCCATCAWSSQETILDRMGSLHFVAGLNGTGKSSLLRALYETFRCLEADEMPRFPVAMAYEIDRDGKWVMVIFRHLGRTRSEARFVMVPADLPLFAESQAIEKIRNGMRC